MAGKTTIRVIKDDKKPKRKKSANKSKAAKEKKNLPKPLRVLFKPFIALGKYFKLSWIELRQVRWPNRRTTWKLTFIVIGYCIIFVTLITLLDILFQFIFNKALG